VDLVRGARAVRYADLRTGLSGWLVHLRLAVVGPNRGAAVGAEGDRRRACGECGMQSGRCLGRGNEPKHDLPRIRG
jgi:hypothetical protein